MPEQRTWLVCVSAKPYVNGQCALGLDLALALGAFGQTVHLLLEDDALALLYPHEAPADAPRHLGKQLASLPFYDIEEVLIYASAQPTLASAEPASPEHINEISIQRVSHADIAELIKTVNHTLCFR